MNNALVNLKIVKDKQKWFRDFVAIFSVEATYKELADRLAETYRPGREHTAPVLSSRSGGAAAVASPSKDAITKLKEYCDKNRIPEPEYKDIKSGEQRFRCQVTVDGRKFGGEVHPNKKDAKKDAAQNALYGLKVRDL